MSAQTFIVPPESRDRMAQRIAAFLVSALPGKRLRVEVGEFRKRRSDEQNRYLWGYVYPHIIASLPDMAGWTPEDLHEFFLGEHFGWQRLHGFGRTRMKPIRRSSKLTTAEFSDYVAHIQQFMAERGVYVDDPNEIREAA